MEEQSQKVLRIFVWICSIIIETAGLGILVSAIYLWVKSSFNTVVIALIILGIVVIGITILLMIFMERRQCVTLVFICYTAVITAIFLVVAMVVRFYKKLIDDLAKKLEDSEKAIEQVKKAMTNLKDPLSYGFFALAGIGIINVVLLICYRHRQIDIDFEHDYDILEENQEKGRKSKNKLYNDESLNLY